MSLPWRVIRLMAGAVVQPSQLPGTMQMGSVWKRQDSSSASPIRSPRWMTWSGFSSSMAWTMPERKRWESEKTKIFILSPYLSRRIY